MVPGSLFHSHHPGSRGVDRGSEQQFLKPFQRVPAGSLDMRYIGRFCSPSKVQFSSNSKEAP